MKRIALLVALASILPASLAAQENAVEQLQKVRPAHLTEQAMERIRNQVMERIRAAEARELPVEAMANLALEGVAKGRSAEEVLGAVELLVADMGRAQQALQGSGRPSVPGDVEAATAAMRMGVDGRAVSELARTQPEGRSMAVPLLVLAGLTERGLPSDEALAAVRERLASGLEDAELLAEFSEVARGLARGIRPEQVGHALASGFAGFQVPVAGIAVPVGPKGGPPQGLPGRGPPGQRPGGGG